VLKLTDNKLQIAIRRNNFIIFILIMYATCCGHISTTFIRKYTLSETEVDMLKTVFVICEIDL